MIEDYYKLLSENNVGKIDDTKSNPPTNNKNYRWYARLMFFVPGLTQLKQTWSETNEKNEEEKKWKRRIGTKKVSR